MYVCMYLLCKEVYVDNIYIKEFDLVKVFLFTMAGALNQSITKDTSPKNQIFLVKKREFFIAFLSFIKTAKKS